ncbi:MAG: NAD-dependent epimerase/dehydratase family protein [Deltaproteobacteria bacterium]|nr:NAD-dependent epimerase/dehydratase family protein [Deltaproteobacteria bacterium]
MADVLVTGSAGFIGSHVCRRLLGEGASVAGVDDFNPRFFASVKRARDADLRAAHPGFACAEADVADLAALGRVFEAHRPRLVVHLAAQTGVRYSAVDPFVYERSNVAGTLNVLDLSRRGGVERVVYASSSSVYGGSKTLPFREADRVDAPISLYAATKKACELMAQSYAHLHGMTLVGLRYFTVYGPWGRPDMAVWKFTEKVANGEPIALYAAGRMRRDFTYVDDVVDATLALARLPGLTGHEVFNVGGSRCEDLSALVSAIEAAVGRPAVVRFGPPQPGDMEATWADTSKLAAATGHAPRVPIAEGVPAFVRWYLDHGQVADAVRRERREED